MIEHRIDKISEVRNNIKEAIKIINGSEDPEVKKAVMLLLKAHNGLTTDKVNDYKEDRLGAKLLSVKTKDGCEGDDCKATCKTKKACVEEGYFEY